VCVCAYMRQGCNWLPYNFFTTYVSHGIRPHHAKEVIFSIVSVRNSYTCVMCVCAHAFSLVSISAAHPKRSLCSRTRLLQVSSAVEPVRRRVAKAVSKQLLYILFSLTMTVGMYDIHIPIYSIDMSVKSHKL